MSKFEREIPFGAFLRISIKNICFIDYFYLFFSKKKKKRFSCIFFVLFDYKFIDEGEGWVCVSMVYSPKWVQKALPW